MKINQHNVTSRGGCLSVISIKRHRRIVHLRLFMLLDFRRFVVAPSLPNEKRSQVFRQLMFGIRQEQRRRDNFFKFARMTGEGPWLDPRVALITSTFILSAETIFSYRANIVKRPKYPTSVYLRRSSGLTQSIA